jgi:hypothetical protein
MARDPRQARWELRELVSMVQGALEETKDVHLCGATNGPRRPRARTHPAAHSR